MTAENPLAQFQRGFTLGWAGDTLDKGEPALVTSAYKAGRKARAEDDFYRSKEAAHD